MLKTFCLLAMVSHFGTASAAPKPPVVAKKPNARVLMALNIHGHWLEMRIDSPGKVNRTAGDMRGWTLKSHEAGVWLRRGESVFTNLGIARVRVGKRFIHLDIIQKSRKGNTYVKPGIARIENGKLIWMRMDDWLTNPTPAQIEAKRPTSFNAHRKPGYLRVFLDRMQDKYDTDINIRKR